MPSPGLDRRDPAGTPRGLVLMLHGGARAGFDPVGARSASFRRTAAMRNALESGSSSRDCRSGCSGSACAAGTPGAGPEPSPVPGRALGTRPGGGAAPRRTRSCCSATRWERVPRSTSPTTRRRGRRRAGPVVPAPPTRCAPLAGRHLVAGHGSRDRITSARATRAYVDRASGVAASARFVDMGRLGHYMLHRPGDWNGFALRSTLEVLDLAVPSAAGRIRDARKGMPGRSRWLTRVNDFPPPRRAPPRRARHPGGRARARARRAALRAHRARQLLGRDRAAGDRLRPRRQHRRRRLGDQPLRPDARRGDRRLRPDLRPRRTSAPPAGRGEPDDDRRARRCPRPELRRPAGARIVQGAGAAAVPTLGVAIVSARFSGPRAAWRWARSPASPRP